MSRGEFEMAVGSSNMLESSMMVGDGFYTPMEQQVTTTEMASDIAWYAMRKDVSVLCRVCANTSDHLIPIYEGEGIEHQLDNKIQKHLPIEVFSTDSLPIQICYQCASTLLAWDNLVINCIEADKKLRAMQSVPEDEDRPESIMDNTEMIDSDDEPLIASKTKLQDKVENTPIKKKILSKAKLKGASSSKVDVANKSKEGEANERFTLNKSKSEDIGEPKRRKFPKEMEAFLINNKQGMFKKMYRCKLCGHATNRSNNLKTHIRTHKTVLPYTCIRCGKKYQRRQNTRQLSENIEIVSSTNCKKMYRCRICGHVSNRSNNLKKHLESHDAALAVTCAQCGEKCLETDVSNYHVKEIETISVTDEDGKIKNTFRCTLCRQTFPRKSNVRMHLATHKPVNIFSCTLCGKEYMCEKSLNEHIKNMHDTETNILPFKCEFCDKQFRVKDACEEHRMIHAGERPYVCQICGNAFRTQGSLYIHSKLHVERPFS